MADDLFCFAGINGTTDVVRHLVSTYQPSEVITFKIELDKLGLVFTGKASFANRLDLAYTVTGMIDTIT